METNEAEDSTRVRRRRGAAAERGGRYGRGGVRYEPLVVFVIVYVALCSWVLATPLGSAPDEPAHVVKAVSVWQGELRGSPRSVPSLRPGVDVDLDVVHIPDSYLDYAAGGQCSW
ncbi:MAG TPA: hypothetical protein PLS63_13025, partial [Microthrixaceae bacterium]|nr:hypothetical protein [Microthrixaceae bacterium]